MTRRGGRILEEIEYYDSQTEEWTDYIERVDQFFEVNGLTGEGKADQRHSTFLTLVGPTTYKVLKSLSAPTKPKEKTFEHLVELLTKYFSPKPSEVMQSYRFFTRSRRPGETIAEYIADLRRLATHCNNGDMLERLLRDHLVTGFNEAVIQKKLLSEPDLTLIECWLLHKTQTLHITVTRVTAIAR